ncbi:hypothetical protein DPMN_081359 [Dreissena polymorpha]|uniref:Uncharacterized protein n=1 Tax=Dreissena polymorpha TaxID=45954 RepID=A0A9D3Y5U4_DREPO|nr:hypothetical protein DPMN_081359 [Dreissena polymorpha]
MVRQELELPWSCDILLPYLTIPLQMNPLPTNQQNPLPTNHQTMQPTGFKIILSISMET